MSHDHKPCMAAAKLKYLSELLMNLKILHYWSCAIQLITTPDRYITTRGSYKVHL